LRLMVKGKEVVGKVTGLGTFQPHSHTPISPISPIYFRMIVPAFEQAKAGGSLKDITINFDDIEEIDKALED
jgi:hypothetical protein